jgi:hypothetical protein
VRILCPRRCGCQVSPAPFRGLLPGCDLANSLRNRSKRYGPRPHAERTCSSTLQSRCHFSSFIVLHTSVVCPVFESITVFEGRQLQVTVLAFSCLTTTQCSMSSAMGGGSWLRTGGGVAATGCFFAAQPARSRQNTSQAFFMPLFCLSRARLSVAILVTRPQQPVGHS